LHGDRNVIAVQDLICRVCSLTDARSYIEFAYVRVPSQIPWEDARAGTPLRATRTACSMVNSGVTRMTRARGPGIIVLLVGDDDRRS